MSQKDDATEVAPYTPAKATENDKLEPNINVSIDMDELMTGRKDNELTALKVKDIKTSQAKGKFHHNYRKAGCCSRWFIFYCGPLLNATNANNGEMTGEMIEEMRDYDEETDDLTRRFQEAMARRVEIWKRQNPGKDIKDAAWQNILTGSLWSVFRCQAFKALLCSLFGELFAIAYTYFIVFLVEYIVTPEMELWQGLVRLAVFILMTCLSSLFRNQFFMVGGAMAINIRKVLVSSMYDKIGKLSIKSLTETNSGKLISLVSSDLFQIERALSITPMIIIVPIINILVAVIIGFTTGPIYAVTTFSLWLIMMILQWLTTKKLKSLQIKQGLANDQRMKLVNDMVTGIRTIKCYAWENHYIAKIKKIRSKQQIILYKTNMLGSLGFSIFQNLGLIAVLVIYLPEWYQGKKIEVGTSFATLAMVFYVFFAVNNFAYYALMTLEQFVAIMIRMGDIYKMGEHKLLRKEVDNKSQVGINLKDCSYTWGFAIKQENEAQATKSAKLATEVIEKNILKNVNIDLEHDGFLAVVGKVGTGKTSFLYTIMDETIKVSGDHNVRGSIAYVEQEPFIFSGTIRDNITFGKEYNKERFDKCIEVSQLTKDMPNFTQGASTIVGERGVNISGGQKARISLARAVYADADIYLLDDPLSAVDPEVASKLFYGCIRDALADKCVILVTHQLQFLKDCPKIMIMKGEGENFVGNFKEIQETGFDIEEILQSYNQSLSDKKDKKDQTEEMKQQKAQAMEEQVKKAKLLADDQTLRMVKRNSMKAQERLAQEDTTEDKKKAEQKEKEAVNLIVPETKIKGRISCKDLGGFGRYSWGWCGYLLITFICLTVSFLQLVVSYWLGEWTAADLEEQQKSLYPTVFAIIVVAYMLFSFVKAIVIFTFIISGATNLHNSMVKRVLRTFVLFFDSNPIGRVMTRFSKDLIVVDIILSPIIMMITHGMFRAIFVAVSIAILSPYMLIVIAIVLLIMVCVMRQGSAAMVESQRLDGIYRGPIHNTFDMVINGLVSLRAYQKFGYFKLDFNENSERSANVTWCYYITNRWIGIRLDMVCLLFSSFAAASVVGFKGQMEPEEATFILQIITDVIVLFSISLRMYAEFENYMTSVQKIIEYANLDEEDDLVKKSDDQHKQTNWPMRGQIEFTEATMRYRQGLAPSVESLTIQAQAGMKVGIVGRTGAGKSSILQTLFRLTELEKGKVEIDGVDIKTLGLHMLRKNVAFIPQTPFLIQGTIRENLDPFNECTDEQINGVIQEVNLEEKISSLPEGLMTYVSENNNLFSVGQKQLVCLARAIIRKTKILVLDEATANVDLETDNFIQTTLREKFKNCTVFIIAHRLATVIDADRILVMSKGKCQEYDHPLRLLVNHPDDPTITNVEGYFSQMVLATGAETAQSLFEIAQSQYQESKGKFTQTFEPKDTFSVVDNRTGRKYELNIKNGAISAVQLGQIRDAGGNVTRCFDPAYMNTVNCISRISFINGEKGILEYRGYPIEQLAEKANYLECVFLLLYGELPSKKQQAKFTRKVMRNSQYKLKLNDFIKDFEKKAHPMGMLSTLVAAMSSFYPEANPAFVGQAIYKTQKERDVHMHRIIGQAPALAAACFRHFQGKKINRPREGLGYVENFMHMMFYEEGKDNHGWYLNPKIIRAVEILFILHAEHELNCSTAAIRHMTSSVADIYTSLGGAVTALYGPRHGGANEAVLKMLSEIGSVENIPQYIKDVKAKKRVLMGFGHRVYKNYDPRAKIVRSIADDVFSILGREDLIDVAMELEKIALNDEYFIDRKLYPNVDFYSGVIYKAMGLPAEFFTIMFALPRFSGWLAHWNEFTVDPDNKIVRPRQIYLGERARDFVPLNERTKFAEYINYSEDEKSEESDKSDDSQFVPGENQKKDSILPVIEKKKTTPLVQQE